LRIRPGRSPEQGSHVLGGLARLNPIASVNFPKLLRSETTRFPWGSTVVVISAIMTDTIAATLAEIAREGHRLVLITLDDVTPPPIRNLLTFRVDSTTVQDPTPHRRRYAIQMNPAPLTGMGVTQESDG
jgi:hypothetical protein